MSVLCVLYYFSKVNIVTKFDKNIKRYRFINLQFKTI